MTPEMIAGFAILSCVLWAALLALPWRPWSVRETVSPIAPGSSGTWPPLTDISALIPARDEAKSIAQTLRALATQGTLKRVILVDDQSSDGTAAIARGVGISNLEVVTGAPPPAGWSGKLWALEQGLQRVDSPYLLLLDADIELGPGILPALLHKLLTESRTLVSVMATLSMRSSIEKILIPPFIYFFKLIYPFALANDPDSRGAAAAGGCILVRSEALRAIGGFAALRGALIDDCTLARRIKDNGGSLWLGLSREVRALRPYAGLGEIWNMVARTAFTQLRYSTPLLLLCTLLMALSFVAPVVAMMSGSLWGAIALATMLASYLPTVRYYGLSASWLPTLPAAGVLYLAMTWTSALRYWMGERSRWKDRVYPRGG